MICVVIPFFQQHPGLLRRAVDSVLRQRRTPPWRLIVVDDDSPTPVAPELEGLPGSEGFEIIRRPNGGPSAARNTGLEAAGRLQATSVAFLDSDDEWDEDHLTRAMQCLQDHDVFVSNWYPPRESRDAYSLWKKLVPASHTSVGEGLYSFVGDLFIQEIWDPISKPSTLVYNHSRFPQVRFDETLRCAEDKLFFLTLISAGARCAFSATPTVRGGSGVNIYNSADFGTQRSLPVYIDQARCHRAVERLPNGDAYSDHLRRKRDQIITTFAYSYLAIVRQTGRLNPIYLATVIREEPRALSRSLLNLLQHYVLKLIRRP